MRDSAHYVQFFDSDSAFVQAICAFIHEAIISGGTCIVAATLPHQEQIDERLRALGLNPVALAAEYRYIELEARSTLATYLNEGKLDRHRFHNDMNELMRQAASGGRPIYAVGEMASMLAQEGTVPLAVQLEELWNELSRHFNFTMYCPYSRTSFPGDTGNRAFKQICAVHSHVIQAG